MAAGVTVLTNRSAMNATAFACDLARVHRSVAECDACTWWSPPDLVSDRQILRGKIEASDRPDGDAPAPPLRPSTSWWMCVNKPSTSELLRARTSKFIQLVQIAITSGLLHAPSLAPYVLYMHEREEDFDDELDELGRWLRAQGVRVVNAKLSFAKHIPPIRWRMKTLTGICKMDIPRAAHALAGELASRNLDPHRILWTDADIIWAGDWSFPVSAPLPTFAAGTETFSGSLNSGVIYGNVSTMVNEWPAMLAYAIKRRFKFTVADQSWMSLWFGKKRWQVLDDEMFNARPFVHPLRKRLVGDDGALLSADLAPPVTQPRLWHWHGYKSGDVQCWLDAMANGSWPELMPGMMPPPPQQQPEPAADAGAGSISYSLPSLDDDDEFMFPASGADLPPPEEIIAQTHAALAALAAKDVAQGEANGDDPL